MKQTKKFLAWILTLALLMGALPGLTVTTQAADTEEAAQTEAAEEAAEEAAPKTTEAPVETEALAPTEAAVPEITEASIPETMETTAPAETEETVPETAEATIPEETEETVPETTEETFPGTNEQTVPETFSVGRNSQSISVGESKTVTVPYDEYIDYLFIPETGGEYVFHTPYINQDTYETSVIPLIIECDSWEFVGEYVSNGVYSGYACQMTAGKEYILSVTGNWDSNDQSSKTGTVRLDRFEAPESISIVDSDDRISQYTYLGWWIEFKVKLNPETSYVKSVTWNSSNPSVLALDPESVWGVYATFDAKSTGAVTVTVSTDNGLTASRDYGVSYEMDLDVPSYGDITATVHCSAKNFKGVQLNGTELSSKYYSVTGSTETVIVLDEDYLETLPNGSYYVTILFTDGEAKFAFNIVDDAGDLNGDGKVNTDDALHLVLYLSFPDRFQLRGNGDLNSDGKVNTDDALHLVLHLLYPKEYPLYP